MLKRSVIVVLLTWVPVALLALHGGLAGGGLITTNFFADFAAHAQFLIAMPLFMLAEPIVEASTRDAARQFLTCGIIRAEDHPRIYGIQSQVKRLRLSYLPEIATIVIAYTLSLVILVPEFGSHPLPTWHVRDYTHWRTLTGAGAWEFLVALPLLNYTWLRFVWKILIWTFYLYRVSIMRLELHATHPDLTGGIGFVSYARSRFAAFILAYGISNVAATVGYEIAILHYDLSTLTVWGPLVGFTIGAPLLFTLPLFMFTEQLYRSKRHALALYRERVTEHSRLVEKHWLGADHNTASATKDAATDGVDDFGHDVLAHRINACGAFRSALVRTADRSSFASVALILPVLHVNRDISGSSVWENCWGIWAVINSFRPDVIAHCYYKMYVPRNCYSSHATSESRLACCEAPAISAMLAHLR